MPKITLNDYQRYGSINTWSHRKCIGFRVWALGNNGASHEKTINKEMETGTYRVNMEYHKRIRHTILRSI